MNAIDRVEATFRTLGFQRQVGRDSPTYAGNLRAGKISVPVQVEVPDPGFLDLPVVRIADSFLRQGLVRGHLAEGNALCYADSNMLLLDRYQPAESIQLVLNLAADTLKSILHDNVDPAIQAEITAYWKGKPYLLIDDPRQLRTGCLAGISWDGDTHTSVIAEHKERLEQWCQKTGAECAIESDAALVQVVGDIPPPPILTNYGVAIDWVLSLNISPDLSHDVLFGSANKPPAVVVVGNNGVVGFTPLANDLIRQASTGKGFRQSATNRLWRTEAGNLKVARFHGRMADHKELISRNTNQLPPLAGKRIALVGCGTIGGYLARMLVQNGAGFDGTLVLIDHQLFLPENSGRHILGIECSGLIKSRSLAKRLNRDFPDASIDAIISPIQKCWGQFRHFDLVIDATGMEQVSSALNNYARQMRVDDSYPPVLYTMIFGNGIAVQTFLNRVGNDEACYKCLKPRFDQPWRFNPVKSNRVAVRMAVRPCSVGAFTPYSVEASVSAATLALRHVLDVFTGDGRPTLRTRAVVSKHAVNINDKTVAKSDHCPECND